MASILKVDTLQKPDGSTPTAADLGVSITTDDLPSGSVVQKAYTTSTGQIIQTSNNWITVLTLSFTPKYADSKLMLHSSVHLGTRSAGELQFDIRYLRNGGSVTENLSTPAQNYYDIGRDGDANGKRHFHYDTYAADSPNTTSAVTYTVQIACPEDAYPDIYINFLSRAYSTFFIEEIKA